MRRKNKRATGRPTKYSRDVARKICQAVAKGSSRHSAAALAGITATTLFTWLRDRPAFADAIEKADSKFEAACIASIRKAGKKSLRQWTASAWLLERKFPERFGKIERHLIRDAGRERAPLPTDYVEAIMKALGVRGPLISINDKGEPVRALPAGRRESETIDLEVLPRDADDLDPLPILPN